MPRHIKMNDTHKWSFQTSAKFNDIIMYPWFNTVHITLHVL